jgi:hypothetical protein
MKKELDDRLCRRYPTLYLNRSKKPSESLMHWGFACGDGWYNIIDVVSELLTKNNPKAVASQVKEKFGGLRYYYSGFTEYSSGVVGMAEHISMQTCDRCGAPGKKRPGGWVTTMCLKCALENNVINENEEEEDGDVKQAQIADLGAAWSKLFTTLEYVSEFNAKHNGVPPAAFTVSKQNNVLNIGFNGGNDRVRGAVDFINHYAARIDEETGEIKDR